MNESPSTINPAVTEICQNKPDAPADRETAKYFMNYLYFNYIFTNSIQLLLWHANNLLLVSNKNK